MTATLPARRLSDRARALRDALARYPASIFHFDPRIRDGWLSDRYFLRTAATLAHDGRDPSVTLQLFAKHHGVVAGLFEGVRLLQTQLAPAAGGGEPYDAGAVTIDTLLDGDAIEPWETVMLVRGPYREQPRATADN